MPQYVMAGMAIYGAIQGARKSPEEKQAAAMAANMQKLANRQHTMAEPALRKAMEYYTQLATGDRNKISSMLAPQINQMNDLYSGAERSISMNTRGATRDRQLSELKREQAGNVSMLPFMARQGANENLARLGQGAFTNSLNANNSALPFMNFAASRNDQRQQGWMEMGETLMTIFAPYLMQRGGQKRSASKMPYGNFFTNGMRSRF